MAKNKVFLSFTFFLGCLLIILPAISLTIPAFSSNLLVRRNLLQTSRPEFNLQYRSESAPIDIVAGYPHKVIISSLAINKEIKPSRILGGFWEIHDNDINYGLGSSLPDQEGNVVVFAHARKGLFSSLKRIKIGEKIDIETNRGKTMSYEVIEKKEVRSDDLSVLHNSQSKSLTLFTCSGVNNSRRFVVTARAIRST